MGRRPGTRHAGPARTRPGRRRPASRAAHVDRRLPPRRPLLLPAGAVGGPHRGRLAARGDLADRPVRHRRRGRHVVARPLDRWPRRRVHSRAADGGVRLGDRGIDLHLEPEPDRLDQRGRPGRRMACLVDAESALVARRCGRDGGHDAVPRPRRHPAAGRRRAARRRCAPPGPGRRAGRRRACRSGRAGDHRAHLCAVGRPRADHRLRRGTRRARLPAGRRRPRRPPAGDAPRGRGDPGRLVAADRPDHGLARGRGDGPRRGRWDRRLAVAQPGTRRAHGGPLARPWPPLERRVPDAGRGGSRGGGPGPPERSLPRLRRPDGLRPGGDRRRGRMAHLERGGTRAPAAGGPAARRGGRRPRC